MPVLSPRPTQGKLVPLVLLLVVSVLVPVTADKTYLLPPATSSTSFEVSTFSGVGGNDGAREVGEAGTTSMAPDGTLYIADRFLFKVNKFKNGVFTEFIRTGRTWDSARGRSLVPCGVFAKSSNEIYVSYCDLRSVDLFNGNGNLIRSYSVNVGLPNMGYDWGGGLAVDNAGNIFLSEEENQVIIRINGATGASEIYAGIAGTRGFTNGAARSSTFNVPRGLAIDSDGSLIVADTANNAVRKIDTNLQVSTLLRMRCEPAGVDIDSKGSIYVVGSRNCGGYIYKVGFGAIYDDYASSTNCSIPSCVIGKPAFAANSTISIDRFGSSPSDNILITDYGNSNLKIYSNTGRLISNHGGRDGYGISNLLQSNENQLYNFPVNVFPVEDGTYLVVDLGSVRHLSSTGQVLKVTFLPGACWYSRGVAITSDGTLYCSDFKRIMVRFPDGQQTFIGSGVNEHRDGNSSTAGFQSTAGMAVWNDEVYVIEDSLSGYVRKVTRTPGTRSFQVSTILGNGTSNQEPSNFMNRNSAVFRYPNQIAFDLSGNMFITGSNSYLWKTNLNSSTPVTRIPGDFGNAWVTGLATDSQGRAFITTEFSSLFVADNVISRITPEGHGSKNGNAADASFARPRVTFVDQQGSLLVADTHNQLIRKIKVGSSAGYGLLTTSAAKPFMATTSSSNNSNSNSGSSSNTSPSKKPAAPSFSGINFVDNKVNISVNIGSGANTPDKVYLVAPKLGISSSTPKEGAISGSVATWSIAINDLLSGVSIPLEIVSEKDGEKSDSLTGNYKVPDFADAKKIPSAPKNFKSRIVGDIALVTADVTVKPGAIPTGAYLTSKSLGITKANSLPGDVIGKRAVFEIPIRTNMAGKKYPVSLVLTNNKGESKSLTGVVSIPALPKVPNQVINAPAPKPPQTIICIRSTQTRAFTGSKCPPGWKQG